MVCKSLCGPQACFFLGTLRFQGGCPEGGVPRTAQDRRVSTQAREGPAPQQGQHVLPQTAEQPAPLFSAHIYDQLPGGGSSRREWASCLPGPRSQMLLLLAGLAAQEVRAL